MEHNSFMECLFLDTLFSILALWQLANACFLELKSVQACCLAFLVFYSFYNGHVDGQSIFSHFEVDIASEGIPLKIPVMYNFYL